MTRGPDTAGWKGRVGPTKGPCCPSAASHQDEFCPQALRVPGGSRNPVHPQGLCCSVTPDDNHGPTPHHPMLAPLSFMEMGKSKGAQQPPGGCTGPEVFQGAQGVTERAGLLARVVLFPGGIWQPLETCSGTAGGAAGIRWLAARDAAKHSAVHRMAPDKEPAGPTCQ